MNWISPAANGNGIKKPLDGRLFYSRAPNENEHQTAVLKQRISRPPPCPLPLHILRPAGLLLPLFLPQAAAGWAFPSRRSAWHTPLSMPLPAGLADHHKRKGRGASPLPLRRTPFRLPSAPVRHTLSMKNAPAGFGRSEVTALKFLDGWWWKNCGCCGRLNGKQCWRDYYYGRKI